MTMAGGDAQPVVSIGMPVRNSEATIAITIASIVAQTCEKWELIVVDDGSSDATVEIVRAFRDDRIRVFVDGQRKGIPIRRNEIISLCRGTYLAWMDSDDIAYPERLQVEVDFLERHPDVDLVAAEMIIFRGDAEVLGKRSIPAEHADLCRHPYRGFPMSQPTFAGRLQWFREFRYDERMKRAQDQDLLLRAFRRSRYAGIQQVLVAYRETKIDLSKILLGRRLWIGSVVRDARMNGSVMKAVIAAMIQIAKLAVDVVAVGSGLNYVILRHRAQPLSASEREKFDRIFADVSDHAARLTVPHAEKVGGRG
jgi:Glycosyl transferase family 2